MNRNKIKALVEWTPRTANVEAGRLANGDASGFDPEQEVKMEESPSALGKFPQSKGSGRDP